MIVHVAKTLGTFQRTICRPGSAIEHFSGFGFSRCIREWNGLFSFEQSFEDEKYFICNVETNGGWNRDDKKKENLRD